LAFLLSLKNIRSNTFCCDGEYLFAVRFYAETSTDTAFEKLITVLVTTLMAWWSELLTTNHEVLGSIPGSVV
jgi:hypothetical protein